MKNGWITAGLAVMMSGAAHMAAAQTLPGFSQTATTTRVAFFSRSSQTSPARDRADVKRTETFLARMEEKLHQPLGDRLSYYRYERPEDIAVQTGVYAYGLTRIGDSTVHSTSMYHPHELVHAVAGRMGDPGRFFHEGLAVVLGDEGRWQGRAIEDVLRRERRPLDRDQLAHAFDSVAPEIAYPAAGSFVQHLIDTEGMPRLIAFFRACPKPADADRAFLATYGRSFASALAGWNGPTDLQMASNTTEEIR